ncbi:hypothetical protein BBP40_007920 [Aspergillus hancockii]|nr:hypothetical protein BBP40_007920 [Aspergillus hancockii]
MSDFTFVYVLLNVEARTSQALAVPILLESLVPHNGLDLGNSKVCDGFSKPRYLSLESDSILAENSTGINATHGNHGDNDIYSRCPCRPGNSAENPIEIEPAGSDHDDENARPSCACRPGDSSDNPIEVDAVGDVPVNQDTCQSYPLEPNNIQSRKWPNPSYGEYTDNFKANLTGAEFSTNGRSLQEHFECKICLVNPIDLVLGCGHPFCHACFNKHFHDSVLEQVGNDNYDALIQLFRRHIEPQCLYCRKSLPGQFVDPEDRYHLEGYYFPVHCPNNEHRNCFVQGYMVQGTRIKEL